MVNYSRKIVYSIWVFVAILFIVSGSILTDINRYYNERSVNLGNRMGQLASGDYANKFAHYGSSAIFIPLMLPGPLPTMVNIPNQGNTMMLNGAFFIRNVFSFFVFFAIYLIFKRKLIRQHILILVALFSYTLILANSGFALSERFHMPILPFFLIFAGYGVTKTSRKIAELYYIPYMAIIICIEIAWNYFKLAGRGVI